MLADMSNMAQDQPCRSGHLRYTRSLESQANGASVMQCRSCDYVLWNLSARQCPECGEPFAPGEYNFVPNTVRYCCPHCDTAYYGTDEHGHLEPRDFTCVTCGEAIAMDQMILRPAEGVRDKQTKQIELPWEERAQHGMIKAWFKTLMTSIASPGRMIDAANFSNASVGSAWTYLALNLLIVTLVGFVLPGIAITLFQLATGGFVDDDAVVIFLVGPTIGFLSMLAIVALWGGVTQIILRLTAEVKGTLGRTYQCLCYSSGPMLIASVPLIGLYCFTFIPVPQVWWLILAIIMVQAGQQVSGVRASIAVGAFPAVVAVALLIGFVLMITMSMNAMRMTGVQMGPMTGANWGSGQGETVLLQSQLESHLADTGQWPTHVLELAHDGFITEWDFIASASDTITDEVPLGSGATLEDHLMASLSERRATLRDVRDQQPQNVVAHRLGDFVFTYHGLDPETHDPALWTIIMIEDPDASPALGSTVTPLDPLYVSELGGTVRGFARADLAAEMTAQNTLRAAANLPPLPDPQTVRHRFPATDSNNDEAVSDAGGE